MPFGVKIKYENNTLAGCFRNFSTRSCANYSSSKQASTRVYHRQDSGSDPVLWNALARETLYTHSNVAKFLLSKHRFSGKHVKFLLGNYKRILNTIFSGLSRILGKIIFIPYLENRNVTVRNLASFKCSYDVFLDEAECSSIMSSHWLPLCLQMAFERCVHFCVTVLQLNFPRELHL